MKEWLPSLSAGSPFLVRLPDNLGSRERINSVRVDIAAEIILELLMAPGLHDGTTRFRHIANPPPAAWSTLVPPVMDISSTQVRPRVVSLSNWVDALHRSIAQDEGTATDSPGRNPVVKLADLVTVCWKVAEAFPALM